jgi:hypothetical protein
LGAPGSAELAATAAATPRLAATPPGHARRPVRSECQAAPSPRSRAPGRRAPPIHSADLNRTLSELFLRRPWGVSVSFVLAEASASQHCYHGLCDQAGQAAGVTILLLWTCALPPDPARRLMPCAQATR